LRRFVSTTFVCMLVGFAALAQAQQVDVGAGAGILSSPKNITASEGFIPPPEEGGIYPSILVQYRLPNNFGINAETAFRYKQGLYNNFQPYRPILYDVNGVYSAHLAHQTTADFMAGIGGQSLRFYNAQSSCNVPAGGCRTYLNATQFLLHFGVGVRYSFWQKYFVRPEANWYVIPNNYQFHSDNVFRVGATVGYVFGTHPPKPAPRPVAPQ
jgi:hypothetical protein